MKGPSTSGPRRLQRVPNFESGILAEPLLAFGGGHKHVDPKTGLALYGPYGLQGQPRPPLRSIVVGIVGPPNTIADAEAWLKACSGTLTNDGAQPFLYPHFPGFNDSAPFGCEILFGDTWRESIKAIALSSALSTGEFEKRIREVVKLYTGAIEVLADRDPKPQVILCCIPKDVIESCAVRRPVDVRRPKLRRQPRTGLSERQLQLFSLMENADDEEAEHQNLRRALKAAAMRHGIPTQLVWPQSLALTSASLGADRVQDIATRAWNFTTALYHKAGGSPWRLAEIDPGVCFVGISFYRELAADAPAMRTSMAQAFTAAGDGYVLRGNTFEWTDARERSPHLTKNVAAGLLRDVIERYKKQNHNSLPTRIVVHKSSRYWEDELAGFEEACSVVPNKDFVTLGSRGVQFYRTGDYPPLRGTYVKFGDGDLLLYTSGYVPFLRTYPGARVPQPLEILEHHGDSPWDAVLKEVLALTKMNWNSADFSGAQPITIAFARRVGQILAEVSPNAKVQPEYRFYM